MTQRDVMGREVGGGFKKKLKIKKKNKNQRSNNEVGIQFALRKLKGVGDAAKIWGFLAKC